MEPSLSLHVELCYTAAYMSRKMREFLEQLWDAKVITWAQPDGDGGELYEVLTVEGTLLRADSLPLLIAALGACEPATRPLALVA